VRQRRLSFTATEASPGAGEKDQDRNVRLNQVLLLRFLRACPPFLAAGPPVPARKKKRKRSESPEDEAAELEPVTDDEAPVTGGPREPGSVFVTLRNAKPYTLWNLTCAARNLRLSDI
jgi:25S rRNA (uracil2634-N3)-methyltransferase